MSLTDDALRKLLGEVGNKLSAHKREQQGLQVLAATKEREKKLNEFTIKELGQLEGGATTYKAVGKMFLQAAPTELVADLEKQNETTQKDLDALGKKREWLERQISDLNGTLKDVMKTSGR